MFAELFGQGQVGDGEAALGRLPAQRQHAIPGDAVRDRHAQQ
jgi:hypothetical protein